MSADDPICLSVIGADGVPAGLDETDPGELARTEETARRWDITGYEDGDAERVDAAVAADIKDAASGAIPGETMLLHATPSLRARIVALGYRPGETPAGMLPWLVGQAELWRAALVDAEDRLEAAGLDEGAP